MSFYDTILHIYAMHPGSLLLHTSILVFRYSVYSFIRSFVDADAAAVVVSIESDNKWNGDGKYFHQAFSHCGGALLFL